MRTPDRPARRDWLVWGYVLNLVGWAVFVGWRVISDGC